MPVPACLPQSAVTSLLPSAWLYVLILILIFSTKDQDQFFFYGMILILILKIQDQIFDLGWSWSKIKKTSVILILILDQFFGDLQQPWTQHRWVWLVFRCSAQNKVNWSTKPQSLKATVSPCPMPTEFERRRRGPTWRWWRRWGRRWRRTSSPSCPCGSSLRFTRFPPSTIDSIDYSNSNRKVLQGSSHLTPLSARPARASGVDGEEGPCRGLPGGRQEGGRRLLLQEGDPGGHKG